MTGLLAVEFRCQQQSCWCHWDTIQAASVVVVKLILSSDNTRVSTGDFENEGAVTVRGEKGVPVLRVESLETVETAIPFLDQSVEYREVILSLVVPNVEVGSPLGLDSVMFSREKFEQTGGGVFFAR